MKTLNVGIIGTGGIATWSHLPALKKQPDVKIFAVCDLIEEQAQKIARQYDVAHVFTDYKKLLEMDEIDAVHVLTPNFMHMPISVDALNAGKHVMVEKPIARTADEARQIIAAAKANGKKFTVSQNMRYDANPQILKRFADDGEFGDIYFARVLYVCRRAIPGWGVFTDKEKQGGGPLVDLAVHSRGPGASYYGASQADCRIRPDLHQDRQYSRSYRHVWATGTRRSSRWKTTASASFAWTTARR